MPAIFEKQQFSELQKLSIDKKEKDKKESLVVEKSFEVKIWYMLLCFVCNRI